MEEKRKIEAIITKAQVGFPGSIVAAHDEAGHEYLIAKISIEHWTMEQRRSASPKVGDVVKLNYIEGRKFPGVRVAINLEITPYVRRPIKTKNGYKFGPKLYREQVGRGKYGYNWPAQKGDEYSRRMFQKAVAREAADEKA